MLRTAYRISPVLRFLPVFALAMTSLLVCGRAFADSRSEADENRWIPSVAITVGVTIHDQDGAVESEGFVAAFGSFFAVSSVNRETLDRPNATGTQTLKSINVGGLLEIETPALPLPFVRVRPRLFFGGELQQVSSQQRNLAFEGTPEPVLIDPDGTIPFSALSLQGRGTSVKSDLDNIQLGAWVGVSIPVQLGDWKVSIKPSARYLNQKVYFTGIFSHAIRDNFVDSGSVPRTMPSSNNLFLAQFSNSLDVHAVGPGLEIEVEAGSVRSFTASVFISGGAYRLLSDRKVDVAIRALPSRVGGTVFLFDTRFTAKMDPWIYRANVGLRFRWKGAPEGWLLGLGG